MDKTTPTFLVCMTLLAFSTAAADYPLGPSAPTDLAAAAGPGAGAITLAWGAAESLTGVTEHRVFRLADDGTPLLVGTTDGATLGFTESGLPAGATFTYFVTAVDAVGEGPASPPASATTFTAPRAPQDVLASPGALGTLGEASLTWSAPSDGGLPVTAFHVHRDGELVATLPGDATGWTETGLDMTRSHTYTVRAANDAGEGPQSDASCSYASPAGTLLAGCDALA
jgi:titin